MTTRARPTLLHLQMGQDVLYVVLSFFVLAAVILATLVLKLWPDRGAAAELAQMRITDRLDMVQLFRMHDENQQAQQELSQLREQIGEMRRTAQTGLPDDPQIFFLHEADGYYFLSGHYNLSSTFQSKLTNEVVPRILNLIASSQANIVEVIGHTDEQPVISSWKQSNLDSSLLSFVNGRDGVSPTISDNVGLGMARAAAIVRYLKADSRLANLTILPLSGGQAIDVDDQLADGTLAGTPVASRRRIEIRLRHSRGGG